MKRILACILCFVTMLSAGGTSAAAQSYSAGLSPAAVSANSGTAGAELGKEYSFFGKWSGETWSIASKLDYSVPGLTQVERAVKNGEYAVAKQELLNYYENRDSFRGLDGFARDTNNANLLLRDIVTIQSAGRFLDFKDVSGTAENWYRFSVSGAVNLGGYSGYTLIAGGKQDNIVRFNSKESAANIPYLEIELNGQTNIVYPSEDMTIRAGAYGNQNYGRDQFLEVNDTGYPYDDDTRRSVVIFNLTKYSGTASSARLHLYGKASGAGCEVMALENINYTHKEDALTWNTETSPLFSWEGLPEGSDWRQPQNGAIDEWDKNIGNFIRFECLLREHLDTKEDKYARKAIEIFADFALDAGDDVQFPDSLRTGHRMFLYPKYLNYLLQTSLIEPEEFFAIIEFCCRQNEFLGDPVLEFPKYTKSQGDASFILTTNWGITQNTGLYVGAHFFWELAAAPDWLTLAEKRFEQLLDGMILPDGSYNEDCSSYAVYAVESFTGLLTFLIDNKLPFSSRAVEKLRACCTYIMDFTMPNGYDPNYGDSTYRSLRATLTKFARLLDDPYVLYVGSNGAEGTVPEYTSVLYPDNRMAVMRTGWKSGDLYMHINTQNGTHCQPDVNAVIMYAYGKPLLIDTGRKSYDMSGDHITNWQLTTNEAHNTLRVDNTETTRNGVYSNELKFWHTGSGADIYRGYTEMYATAPHTRTVLMIKPDFFIVSDYVVNGKTGIERKYEFNWHLLPDANPAVNAATKATQTNFAAGANLKIIPSRQDLTVDPKQGYYTDAGKTSEHTYMSYSYQSSANFALSTLLLPSAEGQRRDASIVNLPVSGVTDSAATAMRIDLDASFNNGSAYYYISNETAAQQRSFSYNSDTLSSDAALFYLERAQGGGMSRIAYSGGTGLTLNGTDILSSPNKITGMSAEYSGSELRLSGEITPCSDKDEAIKLYAPDTDSVFVNGVAVNAQREGDYIYAAKSSAAESAQGIAEMIAALPATASLSERYRNQVTAIRSEIKLHLLRGMAAEEISGYSGFLEAEEWFALTDGINAIAEIIELFLPAPEAAALKHENTIKQCRALLDKLISDYGVREEAADITGLIAGYEQAILAILQSGSVQILESDYTKDFSTNQGEGNWYYGYQQASGAGAGSFGYLIPGSSANMWVVSTSSNFPRIQPEYMVPHPQQYPVICWEAPYSGTVNINAEVYAHSMMKTGNGAEVVITFNEYPFVSKDGGVIASPNALLRQTVTPNDFTHYTSSQYIRVSKGDRVYFGMNAFAESSDDRIVFDIKTTMLANYSAGTASDFIKYIELSGRLKNLPAYNALSLSDKAEITELYNEIAAFGIDLFGNIQKLTDAVALITELTGRGNVINLQWEGSGALTSDKAYAAPGEIVNLSVAPAAGYMFKAGSLKVNNKEINGLSFIMPDGAVSIACEFEAIKCNVISGAANVKVLFSADKASEGDKVFFTILTEYGSYVKKGTVSVNGVKVEGNYFIMPAGGATVTFEVAKTEGGLGWQAITAIAAGSAAAAIGGAALTVFLLKRKKAANTKKD